MLKSKTITFKEIDDSISKLGKEVVFIKEGVLVNVARTVHTLEKRVTWHTEDSKGVGYDILSFFPDGRDKYIKVVTTKSKTTPKISLSEEEEDFMNKNPDQYHLYILTDFNRSEQTTELTVYAGKVEVEKLFKKSPARDR